MGNVAQSASTPEVRRSAIYIVSFGHGGTHWLGATFLTILPFITTDLGLTYAEAGLLVSAYYVGSTLANVPSGMVVDLTGRRLPFQILALAVGSAALAGIGLSTHYLALAAMAAVMGAANMMWHPAAISYLSIRFPRARGFALAVHGLGASLGDALGPLSAGALLTALTWNEAALVNAVPILLIAGVLVFVIDRGPATTDPAGATRLGLRDYAGGIRRLLKTRALWVLCCLAGFRTMAQQGLVTFLPLYLAHELGIGPFWMGFTMMMLQAGGAVAGPFAGAASDRIGRRSIVLVGVLASTIGILALTLVSSLPAYVAGVSILGFVMFAVRPVIQSWTMDLTPPELGASVTSMLFGTQSALATVMPIIGGFLADSFGLVSVFYFLAAVMLLANVLALLVPGGTR